MDRLVPEYSDRSEWLVLTHPSRADILQGVALDRWLPAIVRSRPPQGFELCYRALTPGLPEHASEVIAAALRAAGVHVVRAAPPVWESTVPWSTLVYGVVRRDVEESATLTLVDREGAWEVVLRCDPVHTHNAHAAGAGGVVVIAAVVWLAGGWSAGVLPGLTTALAGGLWADVARVMALDALERRLRRLTEDVGSALWPGLPAQVLPPPPRLGRH